MKKYFFVIAVLICFGLCTQKSQATERYALKENLNCTSCHYNPSGGGALNIKGRYYERHEHSLRGFSKYLTSLKKMLKAKKKKKAGVMPGLITTALERLSLQGNIRAAFKQTVERPRNVARDNFDLLDATLTLGMKVHDRLNIIYAHELNNLHAGDVFITGEGPYDTYLQVGRYTPPFGLISDDPTLMIRSVLGMHYFLKDIGATIGYSGDGFFINGSVLNGFRSFSPASQGIVGIGDPFRGMAVIGNIGYRGNGFVIGLSGMLDQTGTIGTTTSQSEGLTAAYISASIGRLHLSAEADLGTRKGIGTGVRPGLIQDMSPRPVKGGSASFADPFNGKLSPNFGEKSFGTFIKATYDLLPNKLDVSGMFELLTGNIKFFGDAPIRVTGSFIYWPWKNFSIEPQYKYNRTPSGTAKNAPNSQLVNARRRNRQEFYIYARATF